MLMLDEIPQRVLADLREKFTDPQISAMTADEAFGEFLIWNGIIGWAPVLIAALDGLRNADPEVP